MSLFSHLRRLLADGSRWYFGPTSREASLEQSLVYQATHIEEQGRELMATRDSLHNAEQLAFLVPNLKERIRELDSLGERWQAERDEARRELENTKQLLLESRNHAAKIASEREEAFSSCRKLQSCLSDREQEVTAAEQKAANYNADLNFARGEIAKLANEKARLVAKLDSLEDGNYVAQFNKMSRDVHEWARGKGWWEEREALVDSLVTSEGKAFAKATNQSSIIALIHSELSEALEAIRHGNPPDDKIPEFRGLEAELADTVIRIHDMAGAYGLRVGEAIEAKMAFNQTREYKHGGKVV